MCLLVARSQCDVNSGGDPEHRPWHADYVTPSSNVSPLVKRGVLHHDSSKATTSTSAALIASLPKDASGRAVLRHARKLQTGPIRAGRARGAALDYDLGGGKWAPPLTDHHQAGIGKDGESDGLGGKLEVRMGAGDDSLGAGWGSLVELRIDRARAEGQFKNLSGAGKPFERHADQANPFISTSDFFMNRLIQRNDAVSWAPKSTTSEGRMEG
jgi:DnaJ homolog subfamily C member 28